MRERLEKVGTVIGGACRRPGSGPSSRVRCPLVLVLALTCSVALSCRERGGRRIGRPLVVVCVDGATWDVIDPLVARGELPHLRGLVERGARCDLVTLPPTQSPVVWTTYATGVFPRIHNVLDFTYPFGGGGRKRPVEATERRAPAIWNVASDAGRSVGVVGYYVTHPAEEVNGFIVSDALMEGRRGSTYPPELAGGLELIGVPPEQHPIFSEFLGWDYNPLDSVDPNSPLQAPSKIIQGAVDSVVIRDRNVCTTALSLQEKGVDLFMTYLRVIDHASHRTWRYFDGTDFPEPSDPVSQELLEDTIPAAYRLVDDFIGELLAAYGEDVNVVVVSDHGFGSATGDYAIPDAQLAAQLTGAHRYDGLLLAAGPDIRAGVYEHISLMEVAPLLMALLDLPISAELPGRLPEELLQPGFLKSGPIKTTNRYESEWNFVGVAPASEEDDRRALEGLRALGYVDSSVEAGRPDSRSAGDLWSGDANLKLKVLAGEILFHLMRNNQEEASRLMGLLADRDPEAAKAMPYYLVGEAKKIKESFSFEVFPPRTVTAFSRSWVQK